MKSILPYSLLAGTNNKQPPKPTKYGSLVRHANPPL